MGTTKRTEPAKTDHAPERDALLRDPFNPQTGAFSDNIRAALRDRADAAYDELRESMATFGWVPELPALADERGVVLVGNRRMAVAMELGIDPVITHLVVGKGDAADARRFQIAIASNTGSKRLSPGDRRRIAAYLYQEHEWSQQKIAEALGVTQRQVSSDLRELEATSNSKRGRPRKEKGPDTTDRAEEIEAVKAEKAAAAAEGAAALEAVWQKAAEKAMGGQEAQPRRHRCVCPRCGNEHHMAKSPE